MKGWLFKKEEEDWNTSGLELWEHHDDSCYWHPGTSDPEGTNWKREFSTDWFTHITDIGGRRGLRLAGSITSMVVQGEKRAQHAGHWIWRTSGLNWNHLFSRFLRVPIINWRMLHMKGWLLKKKEENCNTLALEMRGHHDDFFYRRPSKQVTSILLIAEIYSTTSILLTSHTWLLHKLPISQSRKDDFSRKKKRLQQTGPGNVWSSRRLLL